MVAGVGLLALAYLARAAVEIVGPVAPAIPQGPVDIRIADRFTIPVEGEFQRMSVDLVTTVVLLAIAAVGLTTLLALRRAVDLPPRRLERFLLLSAAGATALGLDELLGLHETVGHNLPFLAGLPGIDHPDDVVFALFPLAGLAFVVTYRRVLMASRAALRLFAAALVLAVLASAVDLLNPNGYEEPLELIAVVLILAGFVTLAVEQAAAAIRAERALAQALAAEAALLEAAPADAGPVPVAAA